MSGLDEILENKVEELKKQQYEEFSGYVNGVFSLVEIIKGKKYCFEVQAFPVSNGLKVSVECSIRKFFFTFCGKQKYFLVLKNGQVKDIDGHDFYENS